MRIGVYCIDRRILEGKGGVQGKEGLSLGTCSARASQASHPWVARTLRLYNYLLRFHLTSSKDSF